MSIIHTCPICGRLYYNYPAISRTDNATEICSICGVRQALAAAGISGDAAEQIIAYVDAHSDGDRHSANVDTPEIDTNE